MFGLGVEESSWIFTISISISTSRTLCKKKVFMWYILMSKWRARWVVFFKLLFERAAEHFLYLKSYSNSNTWNKLGNYQGAIKYSLESSSLGFSNSYCQSIFLLYSIKSNTPSTARHHVIYVPLGKKNADKLWHTTEFKVYPDFRDVKI